jgi:hypothetical protein
LSFCRVIFTPPSLIETTDLIEEHTLRYRGYRATPALWTGDDVLGLQQISIPDEFARGADVVAWNNQRLGKLVEEFVIHDLKATPSITWITESLQIQNEKLTLGELDALYTTREHRPTWRLPTSSTYSTP